MRLQEYCDYHGISYTMRLATETENARMTLDGDYAPAENVSGTDFDPAAEVEEIGDWLKIADTTGDYALQLHHVDGDAEISYWGEQKAPLHPEVSQYEIRRAIRNSGGWLLENTNSPQCWPGWRILAGFMPATWISWSLLPSGSVS